MSHVGARNREKVGVHSGASCNFNLSRSCHRNATTAAVLHSEQLQVEHSVCILRANVDLRIENVRFDFAPPNTKGRGQFSHSEVRCSVGVQRLSVLREVSESNKKPQNGTSSKVSTQSTLNRF